MKIPYLLVADADTDHLDAFITVFEKQVAYATVSAVKDAQSFLSFLSACGWKDLPFFIILSHRLPDITVPTILRELLTDTRYMGIPKLVWIPATEKRDIEECRMLGIKHFSKYPTGLFELESEVRQLDGLLKAELSR